MPRCRQRLAPERAESRLQLAMALYTLDKQLQALVELEACIQLRPNWAAPRRLRGELYRERGDLQRIANLITSNARELSHSASLCLQMLMETQPLRHTAPVLHAIAKMVLAL